MQTKRVIELKKELELLKENKKEYIENWECIKNNYIKSYNINVNNIESELDTLYDNLVEKNDLFNSLVDKYIELNTKAMPVVYTAKNLHFDDKDGVFVPIIGTVSCLEVVIHTKDYITLIHPKYFTYKNERCETCVLDGYYNIEMEYRDGLEFYRCDYRN